MGISHEQAMQMALEQARLAGEMGDVPVGAVIICDGQIIAARHNEREATNDPTAHAEILALRDAASHLGRWRLNDCDLVVTLEPCVMCAGALVNARIKTVVFSTPDLKGGAVGSLYNVCSDPRLNHNPIVLQGMLREKSRTDIISFFQSIRDGDFQSKS